jgi:replicative DNA helicase
MNKLEIMPHNLEAEQATLGSLLFEPTSCINKVITVLDDPEMFYKISHQKIYKALLELKNQETNIDLITVSNQLKTKQELESIGGIAYLSILTESAPLIYNVLGYAEIVKNHFIAREEIKCYQEGIQRALNPSQNYSDRLSETYFGLNRLQKKSSKKELEHISTVLAESLEKISTNQSGLSGLDTVM